MLPSTIERQTAAESNPSWIRPWYSPRLYGCLAREVWTWFTKDLVIDDTSNQVGKVSGFHAGCENNVPVSTSRIPSFHTFSSPLGHFSFPDASVSGRYPANLDSALRTRSRGDVLTGKGPDVPPGTHRLPNGFGVDECGHDWEKTLKRVATTRPFIWSQVGPGLPASTTKQRRHDIVSKQSFTRQARATPPGPCTALHRPNYLAFQHPYSAIHRRIIVRFLKVIRAIEAHRVSVSTAYHLVDVVAATPLETRILTWQTHLIFTSVGFQELLGR